MAEIKKYKLQNSMFAHREFYITTTLPYVNSNPHIGHAFEFVMADFFKRYYDFIHHADLWNTSSIKSYPSPIYPKAFLNTGIDEHGQKVAQKAIELNLKPEKFCDNMSVAWKAFCQELQIEYDNFYRTSSDKHKKLVQEFLFNIRHLLYEKSYSGKYCPGCEAFKTEKEIKDNQCEFHPGLELKEISEKNFFFPLSKFRKMDLKEILIDKTLQNELESIVAHCDDLSITRENVSWGIPVPFSNQTIYVWFEALLNYIFAIGYEPSLLNFLEFSSKWKNSLIICGKDNLKFQAYILPAILESSYIKPPYRVLVHGMILDKDKNKMSKSLGNVINPTEQIKKFGTEAFRYYLLAGLNTFQNSSYSEEELINKYNNDLSNNLGNLISRITSILSKNMLFVDMDYDDDLPFADDDLPLNRKIENAILNLKETSFILYVNEEIQKAHEEIQINFNIKNAFHILNNLVSYMNKYYTDEKPYSESSQNRFLVITELLYALREIYVFYVSATPGIDKKFKEIFNSRTISKIILYPKIKENETNLV